MIDLHTHTNVSDGELNPQELVRLAHEQGLSWLAITDHDTINGLDEAIEESKQYEIRIIPGIEVSAEHEEVNNEIHIVGLFINHKLPLCEVFLNTLRSYRYERNEKLLSLFRDKGFMLKDSVLFLNGKKNLYTIGKPDFARSLVDCGVVSFEEAAYGKYLANSGEFYIQKKRMSTQKSIKMIHDLNGLAILAHPFQITKDFKELDLLVEELSELGLDGIEVYYNQHKKAQVKSLKNLAKKNNLLASGGSDLHRINNSRGSKLGYYGIKKKIPSQLVLHMLETVSLQDSNHFFLTPKQKL